jgi:hypothetical protein
VGGDHNTLPRPDHGCDVRLEVREDSLESDLGHDEKRRGVHYERVVHAREDKIRMRYLDSVHLKTLSLND